MYFLGDITNVEVFNVQLPQVGELTKFSWKFPDSRITVLRPCQKKKIKNQPVTLKTGLSKQLMTLPVLN